MLVEILLFVFYVIVVWVIYRLCLYFLRKRIKKKFVSLNVFNGVRLLFRSLLVLMFVIGLFSFLDFPSEVILSITSVTGIIIGFASTEVLGQLVSGIYLISSHPFGVNDLIDVGGTVGIATEIGVNYTTIQRIDGVIVKIPNKKLLDSRIRNYTVKLADELEMRQAHLEEDERIHIQDSEERKIEKSLSKEILGELANYINEDEITRYTFMVNAEFYVPPDDVIKSLKEVCKKYRSIFYYKPHFAIRSLGWRAGIEFRVYAKNPFLILKNYTALVADIASALYEETEVPNQ